MKRALSLIILVMVLCFTSAYAHRSAESVVIGEVSADIKGAVKALEEKDWTICIYMCGTDLESNHSAATYDLIEMLAADIPDDVNVLVMTGGTNKWNPVEADKAAVAENIIAEGAYITPDSEHTQIYSVDDDKMTLVYTYEENLDMGDVCTIEKFLELALYYAPSEHLMVSLWNHGGGPLSGVELDEITRNKISIPEYGEFTEALYNARGDKTDILGFDICLAGNLETALNVAPYADYMVSSAEVEPGSGWNYEWLSVFSEADEQGRTASAVEVAERIIQTYPANEGYKWEETTGLTLALYDLSKADALKTAFNNMASELYAALDEPALYAQLSRRAEKVSAMYAGSIGLLDLYDFAYKMSDLLPSAKELTEVLGKIPEGDDRYIGKPLGEDTFVIYRGVSPDYRECLGVTFFYPTSRTQIEDEIQAGMTAVVYTGLEMSESYSDFIYELLIRTDKLQHFTGNVELKYDFDRDKIVIAVENPQDAISIKKADYTLKYTKTDDDGTETVYDLGCAAVVDDWDNGIFEVPFEGNWFSMEGEVFTCDFYDSNSLYNTCWIPVIMDGSSGLSLICVYIMKDNPTVGYLGQAYDIDYSGVASRSFSLDETDKFRTVLIEENEYGEKYEYYSFKPNEKVISPFITELDGVEEYALKIEEFELFNSTDASYELRGRVWDCKSKLFYTDALELFLSRDISVFSIAPIAPQIYTGAPVTPRVGMRYLDNDILLTSVFQVNYHNNVEKGVGKVVVTIDEDDLKGEIVSEFEIKDVSDIYDGASTDSWYFNDLTVMQSVGAVPADSDLEGHITRAQFVEMLFKYHNPMGEKQELTFTDVDQDASYVPALKWAKSAGIIQGITDKTFAPDKKITRIEMIVMLKRFDEERGNLLPETEPEHHLKDCEALPDWGKPAVHWAVANGIIKGDNGYVLPEEYVTVSEALAMIHRCGE